MKTKMVNSQLFETRAALLNSLLILNDLERRKQKAVADQNYHLMKSLTLVLDQFGVDIKNLEDRNRELEAELNVESVFGELSEFIFPKTKPDFFNSDVFQRLLDGINVLVDSEMKELSRRKGRENYFELVAIQQKFSTRLNYDGDEVR
ncbi:hypothetical protein [Chryseobacterium sp.]|uniref:hypothetical protein n=1 Tax=Chryseobacterium sp. TaxID=1871047 RepID=UPI0012AA5F6B|nr:hypothetical protein [Chryseobacterium sp.]QFG53404.1 hypothetical protein F7R58_07520 [Chryseobacterium sp.]